MWSHEEVGTAFTYSAILAGNLVWFLDWQDSWVASDMGWCLCERDVKGGFQKALLCVEWGSPLLLSCKWNISKETNSTQMFWYWILNLHFYIIWLAHPPLALILFIPILKIRTHELHAGKDCIVLPISLSSTVAQYWTRVGIPNHLLNESIRLRELRCPV